MESLEIILRLKFSVIDLRVVVFYCLNILLKKIVLSYEGTFAQ